MVRLVVLVTLILSMVGQAASFARSDLASGDLADLHHASLHWHGQEHHHHDDGSYQLDGSPESMQHVASDLVSPIALAPSDRPALVRTTGALPGNRPEVDSQAPYLDGLLRPPRA